ncbi:MAG: hypothetical protein WC139_02585 [Candidatus Kapaibacterium sp.]
MGKTANLFNKIITLVIVTASLTAIQSCENNPNDLGLEFIVSDTLNTKLLDSNKDSILITNNNFKSYVNTFPSPYMLVGSYQQNGATYTSRAFVRTLGVSDSYAGATVLSARIKINYASYDYRDSTGTVGFNLYSLLNQYNFTTITKDSISDASIGTTVLGSYNGTVTDTNSIYIPFDIVTAKNWLEYAADTNYAQKNYGLALVPNASSNTIKGFGGYYNGVSNLTPQVIIVANKNSVTDTLSYPLENISFPDVINPYIPADRIVVQNGISFNSIINFNLAKVPPRVIINDAYLRLKIDLSNSSLKSISSKTMQFSMMTDTSTKTNDGTAYETLLEDSMTVSIHLTPYFQKWNYGTAVNYGVLLRNVYNVLNLDRFIFYGPGVQDTTLRPKLLIRYTPRG